MAPRGAYDDDLPQHRVPNSPSSALDSDPTWVDNPLVDPLRIGCCIGSSNMTASGSVTGAPSTSANNGDIVPPWMEWVETGIEFFGCDENAPKGQRRSVFGRAMMLHHAVKAAVQEESPIEEAPKDYPSMHDAFLEALLHEQIKLAAAMGVKPGMILRKDSVDSSVSNLSASESLGGDEPTKSSKKLSKRRRAKMSAPPRASKQGAKVAPVPPRPRSPNTGSFTQEFTMPLATQSSNHSMDSASVTSNSGSSHSARCPTGKAERVSLQEIADGEHLPPDSWVHPDMKLQKDKAKGEPIGEAICANGQEACLGKLREKMELVVNVAMGEGKKKNAKIKKKRAKITDETETYTETRSMIELKLGFLSMQYGMLIRWDTQRTHKAILCVLRKLCHESFYETIPARVPTNRRNSSFSSTTSAHPVKRLEPPPLVVRNDSGNEAMYQRKLGTEVLLVNPPYRIEPPDQFSPSVLKVDINFAVGLSRKSRWTLSMTFGERTEVAQLHWNPNTERFETKRVARMIWELSPSISSFQLSGLEMKLYEQRPGPSGFSRHTASMTMPLGGLVAQPSTAEATSWQVTIPCSHDEKNASITLSFVHQSDYAYWLYRELDARRQHEVDVGSNGSYSLMDQLENEEEKVSTAPRRAQANDEEDEDLWDWLCAMCQ